MNTTYDIIAFHIFYALNIDSMAIEAYRNAEFAVQSIVGQAMGRIDSLERVFRSNLETWASGYVAQLLYTQSKLRCRAINSQSPIFSKEEEAVNCQPLVHATIERYHRRSLVSKETRLSSQNEEETNKLQKLGKSRRKLSGQQTTSTCNARPAVRLQTTLSSLQIPQSQQVKQLRFQKQQQELSLKFLPVSRRINTYSQFRVTSKKSLHEQKQNAKDHKLPFNINHLQSQVSNPKRTKDKTVLNPPKHLNLTIKCKFRQTQDNVQNCMAGNNHQNETLIHNTDTLQQLKCNIINRKKLLSNKFNVSINKAIELETQSKNIEFQNIQRKRAHTLPTFVPIDQKQSTAKSTNLSRKISHQNLFSLIPLSKLQGKKQTISNHIKYPRSINNKIVSEHTQKSVFHEIAKKQSISKLRLFRDNANSWKSPQTIHVHNFRHLHGIVYDIDTIQNAQ